MLLWICARLPLPLLDATAWLLAWLWWWVIPIRRREARQNLLAALPEHAADGGRAVLCRMMHDILLSYLELANWDRIEIRVEGADLLRRQPIPVLYSHLGAWDTALPALGDAAPVACFLRPPAMPAARRFIADLRDRHRVHRLEGRATLRDADDQLAQGRSVFFVQDQRFNRGIAVDFLGRPALTSVGFAVFVLRHPDRPPACVEVWREGSVHHVHVQPFPLPPLIGDRAEDVRRITQATADWYAERIRRRPHGWLWLHRRWRGGEER